MRNITDKLIPVCEPVLDGNERQYVLDCLDSTWISSAGEYIDRFERDFGTACGSEHAVACSSGTAAIHLALLAAGIGAGDEVIVPCFTLIVSASMVLLTGATPVFVDVDRDTWCIDPNLIEEKITSRTKAIMAVHMYGHPCDMDAIMEIAARRGLYVIEDAAQAHGAVYNGRTVGGIADIGCFSFYGNKVLTTGEGGMLVTNMRSFAEQARLLRNQAFEDPRFVHRYLGFNYRLTNLQAAIGLAQCERLAQKVARKREIGAAYAALLANEPDITLPVEAPRSQNVYWMYGIVLHETFPCSRDTLMLRMRSQGIETRPFFYPLHRQPVFVTGTEPGFPDTTGAYPVSERLGDRGLYLPSGLNLTATQISDVVQALRHCRDAA
jgi:perosamine synthetase